MDTSSSLPVECDFLGGQCLLRSPKQQCLPSRFPAYLSTWDDSLDYYSGDHKASDDEHMEQKLWLPVFGSCQLEWRKQQNEIEIDLSDFPEHILVLAWN
ncbi:uncharacterized protein ACOB8E_011945 isoform 1-T1 [Sarcophilus harrisii]